jgi:hypothetical protein
MIPQLQSKIQGLQRSLQRAESDVKFKGEEVAMYKNDLYGLRVDVENMGSRLGEEVQTLKDKLALVERERDALKTSLKEEEVMRIAAEGQIPLPGADEEIDEFGPPVRSPRKQRNDSRDDDDKENVSPKKGAVDLRFIQQELASEKRLRERAEEQIDFMKMECQFQCCSCRIAETQGKQYVHFTPPPSSNGDDMMEDVVIKQELVEVERPFTPPAEVTIKAEQDVEQTFDNTAIQQAVMEPETVVEYSPSTGTFHSVPSPAKRTSSVNTIEIKTEPSSWAPQAHRTSTLAEEVSLPASRSTSRMGFGSSGRKDNKAFDISIHEDVIEDSDDDEDMSPPTPVHEPTGPATPYLTRTITTTTTIPLHFSPATPAFKPGRGPMTPSTVAHAAANAQTPVLGELSLNNLGFDREAALAAIRERRGRARSMAAGHGTPMKQMVEGNNRRDISAPVGRVRR